MSKGPKRTPKKAPVQLAPGYLNAGIQRVDGEYLITQDFNVPGYGKAQIQWTPEQAREIAAALITAAENADFYQQRANEGNPVDEPISEITDERNEKALEELIAAQEAAFEEW